MTTSAASTAAAEAVPTETILSPSVRIVSPAEIGLRQSPETIAPRLVIAIFMTGCLNHRTSRLLVSSPAHSLVTGNLTANFSNSPSRAHFDPEEYKGKRSARRKIPAD